MTRRSVEYVLGAPRVVLPLPTRQMQTLTVRLIAVTNRRRVVPRTYPPQWMEPSQTRTTGFANQTFGTFEYALGPDPPGVVSAQPPLWLQNTRIVCVAIETRRKMPRRVPPQWMESGQVRTTGFAAQTFGGFRYALGPDPPGVVSAQPPLWLQQTKLTLVAVGTRTSERKRFPRQGHQGYPVKAVVSNSPGAPIAAQYARFIGPLPPLRISPLPLPSQMILFVQCVAVRTRVEAPRRYGKSVLFEPAPPDVVPQKLQTVTVDLTTLQRRLLAARFKAQFILGEPTVLSLPPPQTVTVRLVPPRSTRPRTQYKVSAPTALQTFGAADISLAPGRRGKPTYKLSPPTVITLPLAPPVRVQLAAHPTRIARSRLSPPTVIALPLSRPIQVRLVASRPRPTTHLLGEPQVVLPPPTLDMQTIAVSLVRIRPPSRAVKKITSLVVLPLPTQRVETIQVTLTRTRPRPTTKALSPIPPQPVRVYAGPRVTLVRARPRPTTKNLLAPRVIRTPSIEQQLRTISVRVVQTRPRPTGKRLSPPRVVRTPSVEQQLRTVNVKLVQTRPRPTVKRLAPPLVVRTPSVEQQLRTLRVTLVRSRPRPTTKLLVPPAVVTVSVFLPQLSVYLVARKTRVQISTVEIAHFINRGIESDVNAFTNALGPVVTPASQPPVILPLQKLVQARPRPTIKLLGAPTTLTVFPGPFAHLVQTRPRPTRKFLRPQGRIVLPTFPGPLVSLVRIRPPKTRSRTIQPAKPLQVFAGPLVKLIRIRPPVKAAEVRPPTVILPLPSLRMQTILAALVRIRPPVKRATITPPTALIPLPTQRVMTVTVWLSALWTRLGWRLRGPVKGYVVYPPNLHVPGEPRVDGFLSASWRTGRLSASTDTSLPSDGFTIGKPEAGTETDIPDDPWNVGKPS